MSPPTSVFFKPVGPGTAPSASQLWVGLPMGSVLVRFSVGHLVLPQLLCGPPHTETTLRETKRAI